MLFSSTSFAVFFTDFFFNSNNVPDHLAVPRCVAILTSYSAFITSPLHVASDYILVPAFLALLKQSFLSWAFFFSISIDCNISSCSRFHTRILEQGVPTNHFFALDLNRSIQDLRLTNAIITFIPYISFFSSYLQYVSFLSI